MPDDWAFAWGVEDASFGLPAGSPSSPITPDTRERYLMGYNSVEARRAANANLARLEAERKAKAQAAWKRQLDGEPEKPKRVKRERHPFGADW